MPIEDDSEREHVRPKPLGSRPAPAAQNESTAFSESVARSSAFAGDLENWVRYIPPSTPLIKTGVAREDFSVLRKVSR
jgi:hypothetical protein